MPQIPQLISGLFVNPPVLWLILLCVDRYNANRDWPKLFLVPLGICCITGILSLCITLYIPAFPAVLVVAPLVSVFALHRFFEMSWGRSIISAILFTIWLIAWPNMGMYLLMKFSA
jgi:hypothetical protein